jgi:septum formation protein
MIELPSIQSAAVVLASASPRRQELLRQVGIPFVVDPSDAPETIQPDWAVSEIAQRLAERKAFDVAARHPEADVVIGADTVVVLGEAVLGKPLDAADAQRMLSQLSGRTHEVYTGFALVAPRLSRTVTDAACTQVRFRVLDEEEIARYVASNEPMDKAGAYAIQGLASLFVERIEGDYFNIVGLPIAQVNLALRQLGWRVI